jgi:pimeloyl-ACP methyl ester carboxylesterase
MKRRSFLAGASLALAATSAGAAEPGGSGGRTFLVVHGAWSAGWSWKKMHPLMQAAGHRLVTPTCTGVGEREHLANESVSLDTHVQDILNVIKYEDLRDVILLGHSYGGMIATGVADRVPERLSKLVYLDAFAPRSGQSLFDLVSETARTRMRESAKSDRGWRVAANPIPPDTSPEDVKWIEARRVPQPLHCFDTALTLKNGATRLPGTYIYCKRTAPDDTFRQFADCAKRERWGYHELDASHSPHVTAPEALMELLVSLA